MCHYSGRRWNEQWERVTTPRRRPDERVSDAERDAVVADLRHHTGEGRLTLDEFEERVGEVFAARTVADLERARRELPGRTDLRRSAAAVAPRRRGPSPARVVGVLVAAPFVFAALVTVAVSLLFGAFVIWPLFVFGFLCWGGGGCGRRTHHRYDTAADHRATSRVSDRPDREPLVRA